MSITAIVIDDEYLARERLLKLLDDTPEVEVIDTCQTGTRAIDSIIHHQPDCIFLDIKMKDLSGFEVLDSIPANARPNTVFVTAYDEFAIKAFDYHAIDYLLKPFKNERFNQTIDKLTYEIKANQTRQNIDRLDQLISYVNKKSVAAEGGVLPQTLPIRLSNKVYFIKIEEVQYIRASGSYAEIYTVNKKHLMRESLTNLMTRLNSTNFARVHRSTILNLNFIQEVIYSSFGEIEAVMTDGQIFRISKSYRKTFQQSLNIK